MRTLSSDTSVKAEQVHIELIRKSSVYRRLEMVNSLVKTTRQLSWNGICERYANDTLASRIKRFFSLLYKDESLAATIAKIAIQKGIR